MKIVVEAKVVKQAVVKFVMDDLILGSNYDTIQYNELFDRVSFWRYYSGNHLTSPIP